jgi:preprotein translocase SecE subunit
LEDRKKVKEMTTDNKKIMTVSFVALSLLVGFVVHLLLQFLAQSFLIVAKIESNELFSNGIPVLAGAILFIVLQFNKTVVDYTDGVVSELAKVVWPSRKDTGLMTLVVVITLIISGVVIGTYDFIWAYVINYLMN